jgi:hypothetical protein
MKVPRYGVRQYSHSYLFGLNFGRFGILNEFAYKTLKSNE